MPFKSTRTALQDIADAISKIQSFAGVMDAGAFQEDHLVRSAVERQLLIVSEAAKRLGDAAEARFPGPDWRNIRGLGNVLRHEYDDISSPVIWKTMQDDLPALKTHVEQALKSLPVDEP